jgi:hypothetical protein
LELLAYGVQLGRIQNEDARLSGNGEPPEKQREADRE